MEKHILDRAIRNGRVRHAPISTGIVKDSRKPLLHGDSRNRYVLTSNPESEDIVVEHLSRHPNVGLVFPGFGLSRTSENPHSTVETQRACL